MRGLRPRSGGLARAFPASLRGAVPQPVFSALLGPPTWMPAMRVHSYGPVFTLAANSPSKSSWTVMPDFSTAFSAISYDGATRSPQPPSSPTRTIRAPRSPMYATWPSAPPWPWRRR